MSSQYGYDQEMGQQAAYMAAQNAESGPAEKAIVDILARVLAGAVNAPAFTQKFGTELNRVASIATNVTGTSTQPIMAAAVQGAFGSGNMAVSAMDGRQLGYMQGRGFGTMQMGAQLYQNYVGDFYNANGGANHSRTSGLSATDQAVVVEATMRRNDERLRATQIRINPGQQGEGITQGLRDYKDASGYNRMTQQEQSVFEKNDSQFKHLTKMESMRDSTVRANASKQDQYQFESLNASGSYMNVLDKDVVKKLNDTFASGHAAMSSLRDIYKDLGAQDLMQIANEMGFAIGKSEKENRELKAKLDNVKKRADRTGQDARVILQEEGNIAAAIAPAFGANRLGASYAASWISSTGDTVRENNRTGATGFSPEEIIQRNAEYAGQAEETNKNMAGLMVMEERVRGTPEGDMLSAGLKDIMNTADPNARKIKTDLLRGKAAQKQILGTHRSQVFDGYARKGQNDVGIQKKISANQAEKINENSVAHFSRFISDSKLDDKSQEALTALYEQFGYVDMTKEGNADHPLAKIMGMVSAGKSEKEIAAEAVKLGMSKETAEKAAKLTTGKTQNIKPLVNVMEAGSGTVQNADYISKHDQKQNLIRGNAEWVASRGKEGFMLPPGGGGMLKDIMRGFTKEGGASKGMAASFLQSRGFSADFTASINDKGTLDLVNGGRMVKDKKFLESLGVTSEEELRALIATPEGMAKFTEQAEVSGYGVGKNGNKLSFFNKEKIGGEQRNIDAAGGVEDILAAFGSDVQTRMGDSGWEVGFEKNGQTEWKSKEDAINDFQKDILDPNSYHKMTPDEKKDAHAKMAAFHKNTSKDSQKKFEEQLTSSIADTFGGLVWTTGKNGEKVWKDEEAQKLYEAKNLTNPNAKPWKEMSQKEKEANTERDKPVWALDPARAVQAMVGSGEVDEDGKFVSGIYKGESKDSEEGRAVLDIMEKTKLKQSLGSNNPMGGIEGILSQILSVILGATSKGGAIHLT